jgi:hypothetical protein
VPDLKAKYADIIPEHVKVRERWNLAQVDGDDDAGRA